jgi:hypothetical protein
MDLGSEELLPATRGQLLDVGLVRDAQQEVAEVGARVEAERCSGLDQAVEDCGALAAALVADVVPVVAAVGDRSQRALGRVVVA